MLLEMLFARRLANNNTDWINHILKRLKDIDQRTQTREIEHTLDIWLGHMTAHQVNMERISRALADRLAVTETILQIEHEPPLNEEMDHAQPSPTPTKHWWKKE